MKSISKFKFKEWNYNPFKILHKQNYCRQKHEYISLQFIPIIVLRALWTSFTFPHPKGIYRIIV